MENINRKLNIVVPLEKYNMPSKERHLELMKEFRKGAKRHFKEKEYVSSAVDAFDAAVQAIEGLLATVDLHPRVHAQREAFMNASGLFSLEVLELHDKIYRLADRELRYGETSDGKRAKEVLEWMERIISFCLERLGK